MPIDPNQLADEIHDTVIQELSAVLLMLDVNEIYLKEDPDLAHAEMERIKDQIRSTLQDLRNMISYLKSEA
jgi:signal transduction histidine kinase